MSTQRITYGPVTTSGPTGDIRECRVLVGPHHVADLHQTPTGYLIAGPYWGSEWLRVDRRGLESAVRALDAIATRNPKDCDYTCEGRH